jgi:fused signal recognition particle receptor
MRLGFIKSIFQKVDTLITGRGRIDEELFEELEESLLQADVNVHTTMAALEGLREAVKENRLKEASEVKTYLQQSLAKVLKEADVQGGALHVGPTTPTVYLVVGVNGVGKTTSIAKLANRLQKQGKKVIIAAGDTFRAAAIDQIQIWGDRIGCEVVKHREGSDPSAVIFDAIQAARARRADYVIADTAGRIHTRANLMEELKKINRVLVREVGREADEILLVLDATTGQNAISQAKQFREAVPLSGIILAKLDGTARGGIVITIADELKLPIKLIGTGEKAGDIEEFDPDSFVEALLA